MIRTKIDITFIYKLTKRFASSLRHKRFQRSHTRGRPQFYPDALFLIMLLVRELYGYTYREMLSAVKRALRLKTFPALSTVHYRLSKMPPSLLIEFHEFLVRRILSNCPDQINFIVADGTGFSYHDLYPAKFHRGKEIRLIRSHVKICVIIGVLKSSRKRILLALRDGGPYANEAQMVIQALSQLEQLMGTRVRGVPFVADKGYDSVRVIEEVMRMGLIPQINIRGSWRRKVRNELRLISQENVESEGSVYRERYLVESFFGTIKAKLRSHIYAKREDMARKEAMARVMLWNVYFLVNISDRDYFSFFSISKSEIFLVAVIPPIIGI